MIATLNSLNNILRCTLVRVQIKKEATTAEKIEAYRLNRMITYGELSRRCGLSVPHLSKIKCGGIKQPSIESIMRIAKGLEVAYTKLMPSVTMGAVDVPHKKTRKDLSELVQPY